MHRMFRRRTLPPGLISVYEAFHACAEHVDLAQRAMLRCVPSSARSLALPLEVGADTVRLALANAGALMPEWRHSLLEEQWRNCEMALEETISTLDTFVARAAATEELEIALTAVADLLLPLEAFVDAERHFARMKTYAR